jgi:hypothetical protein
MDLKEQIIKKPCSSSGGRNSIYPPSAIPARHALIVQDYTSSLTGKKPFSPNAFMTPRNK